MSNKYDTNSEEGKSPDRRKFLKATVTFSALLVVAGIGAITEAVTGSPSTESSESVSFPRVKVASVTDLEVNQPILFNYPLSNEPNVLVKLGQKAEGGVGPDGDIVAFSTLCQHLGCVYAFQPTGSSPQCNSFYKAESPVGYCCCHGSVYDFLNGGTVQAGPAPRPVPQVMLDVDASGGIYAVGMGPPTIFGHDTGSNDTSSDLQGGNLVSTT
jgi:arsenite oxidase small subunit